MRIGVVGYGTGGRHFDTPSIEAAEGVTLVGVVTRSPERARAVGGRGGRSHADDPATLEAGPGGGLLRDIGSHAVD